MEMVGVPCEVLATNVDEPVSHCAKESAERLAILKNKAACEILRQEGNLPAIVITADTLVTIDGEILEKPKNREEAFSMLKTLSGRKHTVHTGVAIAKLFPDESRFPCRVAFVESADVCFRHLADNEIYSYIDTGEPFDKAGAYGIQEKGALLIDMVFGDFYAVVGLPVARVGQELADMGVNIWQA